MSNEAQVNPICVHKKHKFQGEKYMNKHGEKWEKCVANNNSNNKNNKKK